MFHDEAPRVSTKPGALQCRPRTRPVPRTHRGHHTKICVLTRIAFGFNDPKRSSHSSCSPSAATAPIYPNRPPHGPRDREYGPKLASSGISCCRCQLTQPRVASGSSSATLTSGKKKLRSGGGGLSPSRSACRRLTRVLSRPRHRSVLM